ncbi:MAG: thioredoxin family protein [Longimicrobiales bacterium]|nr:thioredoxin family protein [Longimicrobiales bacterium]
MNRERFERAHTFEEYLSTVDKNRELWHAVYERVRLPRGIVERASRIPGGWHLVALSEDWCGDAVNTLPVVARLAEEAGWDLRILGRDDNPDLMDAHLTNGRSRSIPVVIVYDQNFEKVGWWGPRPGEIQRWVMTEGLSMPSPDRYKVIRRWYAKDRGKTTLEELIGIVASAA